MKTLLITILAFSAIEASAGGGSSVGPANPAALNCLKLGGELEYTLTEQGEVGYCAVEQWELFRQMQDHGVAQGGNPEVPNPASVNCLKIGGQLHDVASPAGEVGYCVVEQWTLFYVINILNRP